MSHPSPRNKQLAHFDGLDNKAGVTLGFSGLLITLAPDVPATFRLPGVLAAALAAAFALWSFWPRTFPVLEPGPLRSYLRAEERFARLTVLDTLVALANKSSEILAGKGRRLRWALGALSVAATSFALGIMVDAL